MIVALQTLVFFRGALLSSLNRVLSSYYTRIQRSFSRYNEESDEEEDEEVFAEFDDNKGVVFYPPMYAQRYAAVSDCLMDERWCGKLSKVVDLGYHDMSFIKYLKDLPGVEYILGVDLDRLPICCSLDLFDGNEYGLQRENPLKITLYQGNASDPDYRLIGCDAVVAIEMIEHMLPHDLDRLVHTIFGFIKPWVAVITTPNGDFNALFKSMQKNGLRRLDHFFEWSREQFHDWCSNIVTRYPQFSVTCQGVGPGPRGTEHYGCCSQLALFVNKNYVKQPDLYPDSLAFVNEMPPSPKLTDVINGWDSPNSGMKYLKESKRLSNMTLDEQSITLYLSPGLSVTTTALEYQDNHTQCNLDYEISQNFIFFNDEEMYFTIIVPRRKNDCRVYEIEDVNSRLNCTTFQTRKFSKTAQNLMAKNKYDSLVHTRQMVNEINNITKSLNMNKDESTTSDNPPVWNNVNWGENSPYWNQYYKVVKDYNFPFEEKNDESRILDLVYEEINNLIDSHYENKTFRENKIEIPIEHLMEVVGHITQDTEKVKELLDWNGYEVVGDVVVHTRLPVPPSSVASTEIDWPDTSEEPPPAKWMQYKLLDLLTLTEKAVSRRKKSLTESLSSKAIDIDSNPHRYKMLTDLNCTTLDNYDSSHTSPGLVHLSSHGDSNKFTNNHENYMEIEALEDEFDFCRNEAKVNLLQIQPSIPTEDTAPEPSNIYHVKSTTDSDTKQECKPYKHKRSKHKWQKQTFPKKRSSYRLNTLNNKRNTTELRDTGKAKIQPTACKPIPGSLIELCDPGVNMPELSKKYPHNIDDPKHTYNENDGDILDDLSKLNISAFEESVLIDIIIDDLKQPIMSKRTIGTDADMDAVFGSDAKKSGLDGMSQIALEDGQTGTIFLNDINEPSTSKGLSRRNTDAQCGTDTDTRIDGTLTSVASSPNYGECKPKTTAICIESGTSTEPSSNHPRSNRRDKHRVFNKSIKIYDSQDTFEQKHFKDSQDTFKQKHFNDETFSADPMKSCSPEKYHKKMRQQRRLYQQKNIADLQDVVKKSPNLRSIRSRENGNPSSESECGMYPVTPKSSHFINSSYQPPDSLTNLLAEFNTNIEYQREDSPDRKSGYSYYDTQNSEFIKGRRNVSPDKERNKFIDIGTPDTRICIRVTTSKSSSLDRKGNGLVADGSSSITIKTSQRKSPDKFISMSSDRNSNCKLSDAKCSISRATSTDTVIKQSTKNRKLKDEMQNIKKEPPVIYDAKTIDFVSDLSNAPTSSEIVSSSNLVNDSLYATTPIHNFHNNTLMCNTAKEFGFNGKQFADLDKIKFYPHETEILTDSSIDDSSTYHDYAFQRSLSTIKSSGNTMTLQNYETDSRNTSQMPSMKYLGFKVKDSDENIMKKAEFSKTKTNLVSEALTVDNSLSSKANIDGSSDLDKSMCLSSKSSWHTKTVSTSSETKINTKKDDTEIVETILTPEKQIARKLNCGGIHIHSFDDTENSEDIFYQGKWEHLIPKCQKKHLNTKIVKQMPMNTIEANPKESPLKDKMQTKNKPKFEKKIEPKTLVQIRCPKVFRGKGMNKNEESKKRPFPILITTTKPNTKMKVASKITPNSSITCKNVKSMRNANKTTALPLKFVKDDMVFESRNNKKDLDIKYLPPYLRRKLAAHNKLNECIDSIKVSIKKIEKDKAFITLENKLIHKDLAITHNIEKCRNTKYMVYRNENSDKPAYINKKTDNKKKRCFQIPSPNITSQDSSSCSVSGSVATVMTTNSQSRTIKKQLGSNDSDSSATVRNRKVAKIDKIFKKIEGREYKHRDTPGFSNICDIEKDHHLQNKKNPFVCRNKNVFFAKLDNGGVGAPSVTSAVTTSTRTTSLIENQENQNKSKCSLILTESYQNNMGEEGVSKPTRHQAGSSTDQPAIKMVDSKLIAEWFERGKSNTSLRETTENAILAAMRHIVEERLDFVPNSLNETFEFDDDASVKSYNTVISKCSNHKETKDENTISTVSDDEYNQNTQNYGNNLDGKSRLVDSASKHSEYFMAESDTSSSEKCNKKQPISMYDIFERKNVTSVENPPGALAAQAFSGFSMDIDTTVGDKPEYSMNIVNSRPTMPLEMNRQVISEEVFVSGRSSTSFESCATEEELSLPDWLFRVINPHLIASDAPDLIAPYDSETGSPAVGYERLQASGEHEENPELLPVRMPLVEPMLDMNGNMVEPGLGFGAGAGDGCGIHSDQSQDSSGQGSTLSSSDDSTSGPHSETIIIDPTTFTNQYDLFAAPTSSTCVLPPESIEVSNDGAVSTSRAMGRLPQPLSDGEADVSSLDYSF